MRLIGRLAAAAALLTLPLLAGACSDLWDIPTNDPHAPVLTQLIMYPETITAGGAFSVLFSYADPGADIVTLSGRDTSGAGVTYRLGGDSEVDGVGFSWFPGMSGTVYLGDLNWTINSHQAGPHTFIWWLEDSNGSRSNEVEATINVVL